MNTQPKVSVIIPTYNRAHIIEKSLRSVLTQAFSDIEIVIIDDCSVDNTEEIIALIDDERIIYHKLNENGGVSHARNEGVRLSHADIIAFEDSDVEWKPDKLQKQLGYLNEHPEFSMIYCSFEKQKRDGTFSRFITKDMGGEMEGDIFKSLLVRNRIDTPAMLIKKECFLKCGGFDESFVALEDWDFALRFSKEYLIGYIDEPLMTSYFSADGISADYAKYYAARCKMTAKYKNDLENTGLFNTVVADIFRRAEIDNVLDNVKSLLMTELKQQMLSEMTTL